MGVEIERKYRVDADKGREVTKGVHGHILCQAYLNIDADRTIRVRTDTRQVHFTDGMLTKSELTIKGRSHGPTRSEWNIQISNKTAEELINSPLVIGKPVKKIRRKVPFAGLVWEIDEFLDDNKGLWIAEVELSSADQEIELPEWVGEELTDQWRWANANLACHPFGSLISDVRCRGRRISTSSERKFRAGQLLQESHQQLCEDLQDNKEPLDPKL